ncbi:hypothetical protein [Nostoc sp. TCL26-01]|uniref:hypothetical protein n=1 Tax=Nostoc sp. TCL26-01 TaxID=2576904 RepID=UPI0015BD9049|nr:hypothetical protein [Nostoc sp. TCL26-01]QLE55978.1 hypothetical protein FD725_10830 [Nostoc sp. TCL26-01]
MSAKIYYLRDEHRNLEASAISLEVNQLAQLPISQSVTGSQSLLIRRNINRTALAMEITSTVGKWKTQPRLFVYSTPQKAEAIFEQLANYAAAQSSPYSYSPIHKTYRRIAELGADNKTYQYTIEWLNQLRTVVASHRMWWCEPLINLGVDSEIVFEWWHQNHKLTVYILGNTAEYIKVWGTDIDNEMEEGLVTSPAELADLWKWLVL